MSATSPIPNVLLIGGPDAGKSNFLFRFWLAVDSERCALVKDGFPDELQYLQAGSETLLSGKFAGRTSGDVLEHAFIPVKLAADPTRKGLLNVPDVPGEQILEVYRLRQWTDVWESRINAECGCLLFVRAGSSEIIAPLDYDTCLRAFGAPIPTHEGPDPVQASACNTSKVEPAEKAGENDQAEAAQRENSAGLPASPQNETPTDVVLTEWLQFLRAAFVGKLGGRFKPRVGIVVAAWDALPTDQQNVLPFDYLAQNFPLLAQFVETNGDLFEFALFGLSIVSGDLKEDLEFRAKFEQGQTHEFGYVVHTLEGERRQEPDVTLPVVWALGWHLGSATKDGA